MMMRGQKLVAGLLLGFLAIGPGAAQQGAPPVSTIPGSGNSGNASSTLSSANFQLVWAATGGIKRTGCLVIDTATHAQWVYFQGPGMITPTSGNTATIKASSVPLVASGSSGINAVQCSAGVIALQDAVWIAGTSGDAFYAAQQ